MRLEFHAIHYRVESADRIFIMGIYHGARDSKVWRERL